MSVSLARRCLCVLSIFVSSTACSTYRFADARGDDGGLDVARLSADLAASGEDDLIERTWIPLIYLHVTRFSKSTSDFPSGHTLFEGSAFGPLFFVGIEDDQYFDARGQSYEAQTFWGVAWGVVSSRTSRAETKRGVRHMRDTGVLFGIFGQDITRYEPVKKPVESDAPVEE